MVANDVNNEKVDPGATGRFRPRSFEPNALDDLARLRPGTATAARALKRLVAGCFFSGLVCFAASSLVRTGEAAGSPQRVLAETAFSAPQGKTKFDHAKHSQLKCDQCHLRKADAIAPAMPAHGACISCHIKEFTSTQFAICANCHEGITAVRPPVLAFPERQTFGVVFSHITHATYVGGEKRTDCASCHSLAGARSTIPAHKECYVCHKAPDQVKPGEKAGGASCGECHTTSGNKKPPSVMSRAYSFRFTHQVHSQREGIACTECHKVLGEAANPVSVPQLKEHRGAGFGSCGGCHNGRRAFGGELGSNACARCHGRNMM